MAKTGTELANQMTGKKLVNFSNKDEFLRKHGMDKFYEFDGGDLWDITDDGHMTNIRVGYNHPGWDEDMLVDEIEKLGKWKRPDPAVQKLKDAGWSDERIAAAEKGIKEKHPDVDKDAKIKATLKKITGTDWTDEMIAELKKAF